MRKAATILIYSLFGLTVFCPSGKLLTTCFGYTFRLAYVPAFACALAVLSLLTILLDMDEKEPMESNVLRTMLTVITPLSLFNAGCYILACPNYLVSACAVVSTGCCCFLTVKYGMPSKIVTLGISVLMVLPIGFMVLFGPLFDIGKDTVVQSVESPSGKYCAQVIDSDQGALGGDTFVDVHETGGLDAIIFKIDRKPQRVYSGPWGAFEGMQIYWKNDGCLIINSTEYQID